MELTIWEFPLEFKSKQAISVPRGAQPLSVQLQNGLPCLWMLVDTTVPPMVYTIHCVGTGHPCRPKADAYIDTVQAGALVFHFFGQF